MGKLFKTGWSRKARNSDGSIIHQSSEKGNNAVESKDSATSGDSEKVETPMSLAIEELKKSKNAQDTETKSGKASQDDETKGVEKDIAEKADKAIADKAGRVKDDRSSDKEI